MEHGRHRHRSSKQARQKKPANVLTRGIYDYTVEKEKRRDGCAGGLGQEREPPVSLQPRELPKRYTLYEPMLLLGPNFATQTPAWEEFYSVLTAAEKQLLFRTIAKAFSDAGHNVTHVAVNAPIAPKLENEDAGENVMRSPVNLQPLYGDFGPDSLLRAHSSQPAQADFDAAFWVEALQPGGSKQVWAPRWTMFSRGNVSEKARVLGLAQWNQSPFPGLSGAELGHDIEMVDVVDFYVGIGYFAFPYLKRNVRRVFGWEINGWSVEGLRKGCERNGIRCEVVRVPDSADEVQQKAVVERVVDVLRKQPDVRCIVFWGDNLFAASILSRVGEALMGGAPSLNVRHCNLGLLPTSRDSWAGAAEVIDPVQGGWLHVHENAEIEEVEQKKRYVVDGLANLARQMKGRSWQVSCEHTEMVKTYAPGVGHFVFDVRLWPAT